MLEAAYALGLTSCMFYRGDGIPDGDAGPVHLRVTECGKGSSAWPLVFPSAQRVQAPGRHQGHCYVVVKGGYWRWSPSVHLVICKCMTAAVCTPEMCTSIVLDLEEVTL